MHTPPKHRATVVVEPASALGERPRLFAALEAAFPVCFSERLADADALIAFDGAERTERSGLPTLVFGPGGGRRNPPSKVRLSDDLLVDARLRGIEVIDPLDGPGLGNGEDVQEALALAGSEPVWVKSSGAVPVSRVASTLPELEPEQALRDLLGERDLALIATVEFLRSVTAADDFTPAPIRATILFDDPNLRWRTYGFIDYGRLLAHADEHHYHAAMAMIPLDGWGQHRATVDLFRARPDRLSLVLHGNNHIGRELMRPAEDFEALVIAAQALRRAERFEDRYGLRMDRVMTPPHGLASASVTRALGALDYDALCAIHPFPWTETTPADRPLAGWDPAEFSAGCAVIPRLPLTTPFDRIALRAYLDQPLVLYGHHADLAGGLDLLAQTAARVNSLGEVHWASLGQIAERNYAVQVEAGVMRVRPYSQRLRLVIPEGVDSLVVEPPRPADHGQAGWSTGDSLMSFGAAVPCQAGEREVRLVSDAKVDLGSVPDPTPSLWPILRRAATETRDRLQPLFTAGSA